MWRPFQNLAGILVPLGVTFSTGMIASSDEEPLRTSFPLGLMGPGATGAFYTTSLDLANPLLKSSTAFMAAARADARDRLSSRTFKLGEDQTEALEKSVQEHLGLACSRRTKFLLSGVVHDHKEIKSALVGLFKENGQLALMLGGKSVGKSLLLAELAQRTDIVGTDGLTRAVLYVDARKFSTNLSAGLQTALKGEANELVSSSWWSRLGFANMRRSQAGRPENSPSISVSSATLKGKLIGIGMQTKLDFVEPLAPMQRNIEMLSRVVELAERQGLYVCLVVDEANLAFPTHPVTKPLKPEDERMVKETKLLLERIVQLTKQSCKMNALSLF